MRACVCVCVLCWKVVGREVGPYFLEFKILERLGLLF